MDTKEDFTYTLDKGSLKFGNIKTRRPNKRNPNDCSIQESSVILGKKYVIQRLTIIRKIEGKSKTGRKQHSLLRNFHQQTGIYDAETIFQPAEASRLRELKYDRNCKRSRSIRNKKKKFKN